MKNCNDFGGLQCFMEKNLNKAKGEVLKKILLWVLKKILWWWWWKRAWSEGVKLFIIDVNPWEVVGKDGGRVCGWYSRKSHYSQQRITTSRRLSWSSPHFTSFSPVVVGGSEGEPCLSVRWRHKYIDRWPQQTLLNKRTTALWSDLKALGDIGAYNTFLFQVHLTSDTINRYYQYQTEHADQPLQHKTASMSFHKRSHSTLSFSQYNWFHISFSYFYKHLVSILKPMT